MKDRTVTRVYVAGRIADAAAVTRAAAELTAAGYDVAAATPSTDSDAVAYDLDAMCYADAIVVIDDCTRLFEPTLGTLFGIPVATVAMLLAGAR